MSDDPIALNIHIHIWDGPGGDDRYRYWVRDEQTEHMLLRGHADSKEGCFKQIYAWAWAAGYSTIEEQGVRDTVLN